LDSISREARVDYYRCEQCGTVFNKPKDADGPLHLVSAGHPVPRAS
jgi:hypothetical protein